LLSDMSKAVPRPFLEPSCRRALFMFCSPTVAPLDCNPEAKALVAAGLLPASPPPLAGG